jgi:hypothetical protein
MVKTVMRAYPWTPDVIDKLYLDDKDHHGIGYLYEDILKSLKELDDLTKNRTGQ